MRTFFIKALFISITLVIGFFSLPVINESMYGGYELTPGINTAQAEEDACADNPQACAEAQPIPRTPTPLQRESTWSLSGLIIGVTGVFLWIGMQIFDAAVRIFVVGMGGLVKNNFNDAINSAWIVVRDLVNLTFIFGLVYVGFRTILDADMSGTKRMLAQIIIGALLVNFSLFITKVVIDISNVTAVQIYKSMNLTATGSASNISVSAAFMNHMGLVSLYNAAEVRGEIVTKVKAQNPDGEAYLPFIVGGSIFVLVAAFVFAAGGILLIIRFGVLLILMILSPIAFAAQVFPKVAGWSKMWWDKLFAQAFFAPAYFFMIYVTLKVATSYQTSMRGFDNIYSAQSQVFVRGFETAAYFALTIVLMIASIIVAKQMGAVGAARMGAIGKWTARQTTGFMGRNTLGRFADWRAQRREEVGKPSTSTMSRIYSSMAKSTYGGSLSRPQIREAGEKAAVKKARYDQTRKVSAAIAANVSAAPGSSQQEVLEGTISGATTEQLHDMLKGKSPGNAQYDAIVRNMSASQFDSLMKLKPEEMDDGAKAELKKARGRAIQTTLQNNARAAATAANAPIPATQQGDESALRQGISKASTAQLEVLGVDVLEKNALSLSSSQMDDIKKSTKFTESQVARIRTARENALVTEYQSNPTAIFARKEAEIAKLPVKILEDGGATPYFTGEVLRRMQDDGDVLPAVRAKIKANILNLATAVPPGTQGGPTQSAFDYLTANPRGKNF